MSTTSHMRKFPPPLFHVGDRVRLRHMFGGKMEAEIVEDRGPIGVGGRRFYGIRFRLDEWNEITTECAEEELEPIPTSSA
jgi:hypothetical protein